MSNPYRGQSPNAAREHRPVVSMRFSPPSQPQLQHNGDTFEKSQTNGSSNLYMPYRVQAPGWSVVLEACVCCCDRFFPKFKFTISLMFSISLTQFVIS